MNLTKREPSVAYFCMEYGLHEDFKIYSGGLGILAGDFMKAAKDLSKPIVGIGLLWRQGYTSQTVKDNGTVVDAYPEHRYDFLKDTGVEVAVNIRGRQVKAKVWLCEEYGNAPLYLLDTNLPGNPDPFITGQLYGWFSEERIAQEMILGIGGLKALNALNIDIDVYHFNEGHAVFAGIGLICEQMDRRGIAFEEALESVKEKIVFTTHTPVEAGNEKHEHELLKYMGAYNGLTYGQMLKLGGEPFNMTVAALRMSKISNAVAQLHGETSNKMWDGVSNISEITAITNGVHNGTWQDSRILEAFSEGRDLTEPHLRAKRELFEEINTRQGIRLDENVLTIGFARRAAPYKRSDLIFRNKAVIESLLKEKKVQLIFSGKAHPNDLQGKEIVANLYNMARKYEGSVVFIQDYDMKIGRLITRGCDVWLNNPIRPLEASGTSGMKAAMNGVLNLSTLDGWWPEGCEHGITGWQFGDAYVGEDQDTVDLKGLFKVLLEEVIPLYYGNTEKWNQMMMESIKMSTNKFSASRMLEEYYRLLYNI
jgi:glycogen phosphorylase